MLRRTGDNANGFTLLELIISLALVVVLVTVCLAGVRLAVASRESGDHKTEVYQRLRVLHEQLHRTIRSAHLMMIARSKESLLPDADAEQPFVSKILAFEGDRDSLKFVTFADPLGTMDARSSMHRIHIYTEKNRETGKLEIIMEESEFSPETFFDEKDSPVENRRVLRIVNNAAYLRFRYYRITSEQGGTDENSQEEQSEISGEWVEEWKAGPGEMAVEEEGSQETASQFYLPRAVEVSVGVWTGVGQETVGAHPEIISLPASVVPIHTGLVFTPEDETKEEDATDEG